MTRAPEIVFYDGDCGLCHASIRFLIGRDPEGRLFRFAPIGGETFAKRVDPAQREGLPDSVMLLSEDGRLLFRSEAMLHIMRRQGGLTRLLAGALGVLPGALLDAGYDAIARNRSRWFEAPSSSCPVASPELRARFDP